MYDKRLVTLVCFGTFDGMSVFDWSDSWSHDVEGLCPEAAIITGYSHI